MKKAKIMLIAIAVLATVGGALAFKVKKFGNVSYCYLTTTTRPADGECTATTTNAAAVPFAITTIYYTTTTDVTKCDKTPTLTCSLVGDLEWDN